MVATEVQENSRAGSLPCAIPQYALMTQRGAGACFYLFIYLVDQGEKFSVIVMPG